MRKYLLLLLSLLLIFVVHAQSKDNRVLVGDMTGDGNLTISDVRTLSDVVLGKRRCKYIPSEVIRVSLEPDATPPAKEKTKRHLMGDMNDDGKLTVGDVTILLNIIQGKGIAQYIQPDVVYDTLGIKNGHEYVDLGLGVKWATCNVGATSTAEYGNYFAWAETRTKLEYDWSNYQWMEQEHASWWGVNKYTFEDFQYYGCWYEGENYVGDNLQIIEADDDAANVNWGEDWRMATFDEWYDLKTKCSWKWITNYNGTGISGFIVTSKITGYTNNYIFLPAAGYKKGSNTSNAATNGTYWTSSISASASDCACGLGFNSSSQYWFDLDRYYALTVRPVRP